MNAAVYASEPLTRRKRLGVYLSVLLLYRKTQAEAAMLTWAG
jgi:hypothetical protein